MAQTSARPKRKAKQLNYPEYEYTFLENRQGQDGNWDLYCSACNKFCRNKPSASVPSMKEKNSHLAGRNHRMITSVLDPRIDINYSHKKRRNEKENDDPNLNNFPEADLEQFVIQVANPPDSIDSIDDAVAVEVERHEIDRN